MRLDRHPKRMMIPDGASPVAGGWPLEGLRGLWLTSEPDAQNLSQNLSQSRGNTLVRSGRISIQSQEDSPCP